MSNQVPLEYYNNLVTNINYIFKSYLKHHEGNESNTKKYIYDIKTFYLLAHAELEEYFEKCATYVMGYSIDQFIYNKRINKYLMAMLLYGECAEKKGNSSIFDITKKSLEIFKKKQSKIVYNNNGMAIENLFDILHPLGIDIVHEAKYIDAVNKFSRERGGFAHTTKMASTLPTVKDIMHLTIDMLKLTKIICIDIQ